MPTVGIVIVAAGSGVRLGRGIPKAFVDIDGTTMLARALEVVRGVNPAALVIAGPPAHLDAVTAIVDDVGVAATVVAGQSRLVRPPQVREPRVADELIGDLRHEPAGDRR